MSNQTYANHARFIPLFHFVAGPILIANAITAIWLLRDGLSYPSVLFALTAVALLLVGFFSRFFAMKVQDRVIRLEMRLRLRELLPATQQSQINRLSCGQMVGLRFASDAELPALVETTLKDNLTGGAIKKLITNWQADNDRA